METSDKFKSIEKHIGKRYGMVVVLKVTRRGKRGVPPLVWGQCDCGDEKDYYLRNLVIGKATSCGCKNLTVFKPGTKFGFWTVLEKVRVHTGGKNRNYFKCQCACGKIADVDSYHLKNGRSPSCGCGINAELPNNEGKFNELYRDYKRAAVKRGFTFELTKEEFREYTKRNCYYCGCEPANSRWHHKHGKYPLVYNGIDRRDCKQGYLKENVVSSCGLCNEMKYTYSESEFKKWALRLSSGPHPCVNYPVTTNQARQIMRAYKHQAKKRGLDFNLEIENFAAMLGSTCHYCGVKPSNSQTDKVGNQFGYSGIDRADNAKGYLSENCRPACRQCNWAKSNETLGDFLAHVKRIADHQRRATVPSTR